MVLEKPGFEACPPDLTAKGVWVEAMILIMVEISLLLYGSTTHMGVCVEDVMKCSIWVSKSDWRADVYTGPLICLAMSEHTVLPDSVWRKARSLGELPTAAEEANAAKRERAVVNMLDTG